MITSQKQMRHNETYKGDPEIYNKYTKMFSQSLK